MKKKPKGVSHGPVVHAPVADDEPVSFAPAAKPPPDPDATAPYALSDGEAAAEARFDAAHPGLREKLAGIASEKIAEANAKGGHDGAVRCALGIEVHDGVPQIMFHVGEYALPLSPEMADELSADLRRYAIEVRNGGKLG